MALVHCSHHFINISSQDFIFFINSPAINNSDLRPQTVPRWTIVHNYSWTLGSSQTDSRQLWSGSTDVECRNFRSQSHWWENQTHQSPTYSPHTSELILGVIFCIIWKCWQLQMHFCFTFIILWYLKDQQRDNKGLCAEVKWFTSACCMKSIICNLYIFHFWCWF